MATTRTTTRHAVIIKAADIQNGPVQIEELAGASGILPGHLLTYSSGEVIVHGTADGNVGSKLVANLTLTPDTITNPTTAKLDLPYADGDTVYCIAASPQDLLNMLLAAGETAAKGSALVSNGDGTLKVEATLDATVIAGAILGYADEAVDNSGGATAARILVRVA
jgi:hypothetical protein